MSASEKFYSSLLDILVFMNYLSKKETLVFLELFNISQGKAFNDIESRENIDCFVSPSIKHFTNKLGISKYTVTRLNNKINAHFRDYIQIDRQKFEGKKLKGYRGYNRYTFSENTFLALFLLKYNGFLKNKKTVHNSVIKLSEDKGLMYSYEQWLEKKSVHCSPKKAFTINYIIKLINKKIVQPKKSVPVQRTTMKYDNVIPENKDFNLRDDQVELLMNNYSLRVVRSAYRDASWYSHESNKIKNNFAFILSRAKDKEAYINSVKKQSYYARAI